MNALETQAGAYAVPTYRVEGDAQWFHFLHGNVPGHQIDFMYRAEVPQGSLTRQHFSHLARLMKYIEPPAGGLYAFAIGNLSRDDTQHEPGHGGLALMFGMRIYGAQDHAGRPDPPFAHAIALADRRVDSAILFDAAMAFHRRVLGAEASAEWYRSYVHAAIEDPASVGEVLQGYIDAFADLPYIPASDQGQRWTAKGVEQPRRLVIAYQVDEPFALLARYACRIAAVLYRSDLRWSAVTNGREADLPQGLSIRFVDHRELSAGGDPGGPVHAIEDLPENEDELAEKLFNARVLTKPARGAAPLGWRERFAGRPAEGSEPERQADETGRTSWDGGRSSWEGLAKAERRSPQPLPSSPPPSPPPRGKGGEKMAPVAVPQAALSASDEFDSAETQVMDGGEAELAGLPKGGPPAGNGTSAQMPLFQTVTLPATFAAVSPTYEAAVLGGAGGANEAARSRVWVWAALAGLLGGVGLTLWFTLVREQHGMETTTSAASAQPSAMEQASAVASVVLSPPATASVSASASAAAPSASASAKAPPKKTPTKTKLPSSPKVKPSVKPNPNPSKVQTKVPATSSTGIFGPLDLGKKK